MRLRLAYRGAALLTAVGALACCSAEAAVFGPWEPTPVFQNGAPLPLAIADFDGDEELDIVVSSLAGDELQLLAGHGDGTFDAPEPLGFSNVGWQEAWLNGDDLPDLVAVMDTAPDHPQRAVPLIADGAGGFTIGTAHDVSVDGPATSVINADVDGDGDDDVLTTRNDKLYVARSDGSGGFLATTTVTLDAAYRLVAAGAMTDDDRVDPIGVGPDGHVVLVAGQDGSFASGDPIPLPIFPDVARSGVVLDFDSDGFLDAVVPDYTSACVLYGDGTGGLSEPDCYATGGASQGTGYFAGADFDNDGYDDFLQGDVANGVAAVVGVPARVELLTCGETPFGCIAPLAADFDDDLRVDAVAGEYGSGAVRVSMNTSVRGAELSGPLDFGGVPLGATSEDVLVLENPGEQPTTLGSTTISGPAASDFHVLDTDCVVDDVVFGQSACGWLIEFKPSAAGPRQATLTVETDAPGSPHHALLVGDGTTPATAPPRPGSPPPSTPPPQTITPVMTADELLALLHPPKRVRVRLLKRFKLATIANPPLAAVKARIVRPARRSTARVALARGAATAKANTTTALRAKLTKKGRKLLRERRSTRATLELVATDAAGRTIVAGAPIRLRIRG
jgi:hypothetical protein